MWRIRVLPPAQAIPVATIPARNSNIALKGLRGIFGKCENESELAPASHDHALILREGDPLRIEGKRVEDGLDIGVKVAIRNRSRKTLAVSFGGRPELTLGGKSSEHSGGGLTIPFAKESEQTSSFGGMRFYDGVTGLVGVVRIHYKFGETKDNLTNLNIEVQFQVEGEPSRDGKLEALPLKIYSPG